jgi:cysteine synthase
MYHDGKPIDMLVAGGGTITCIAKRLNQVYPNIIVVGFEYKVRVRYLYFLYKCSVQVLRFHTCTWTNQAISINKLMY